MLIDAYSCWKAASAVAATMQNFVLKINRGYVLQYGVLQRTTIGIEDVRCGMEGGRPCAVVPTPPRREHLLRESEMRRCY